MPTAKCRSCGSQLSYPGLELALLLPNGNEESVRLCRCETCSKAYLDGFEEEFMGGCQELLHGPFSDEEGRKLLEEIKGCSRPMDKHCSCPAHQRAFRLVCGRG